MNWTNKKDELLSVPLPENGKTYGIIPHSVLLEELNLELDKQGYSIEGEEYLATADGQIVTGRYQLGSQGTVLEMELKPSVTWVNSYNKQRKASIRGGVLVLVCRNGMMSLSGSSYTRKHMGDNAIKDFRSHIIEVVGSIGQEFENLKESAREMKEIDLNKSTRAQLVGDMLINERLLNLTQLGILTREIDYSKNFKGTSLWDFYNHTTEAYKNNHPMNYDRQHVKFHSYISDKFGLTGARGLYGEALVDILETPVDTTPYEFYKPLDLMEDRFKDALV